MRHDGLGPRARLRLLRLAAISMVGRRWWLLPLLALLWPGLRALQVVAGWRPEGFAPVDVQGALLGVPLTLLAISLGARLIARDLEHGLLETTYTLPGGGRRLWGHRLAAALGLLVCTEILLAVTTHLLFADVPLGALWGALEAAAVYLALALVVSVATRSELAGTLVTFAAWCANGFLTGFGETQSRLSPFFNPLAMSGDPPALLLRTAENRVAFALVTVVLVVSAFVLASRREAMLSR